MIGDTGPEGATCSRAGCDAAATRSVNWRNPKLHSADRVKIWLACDEHVDYLREFLGARNFPVLVSAIGETVTLPSVRDLEGRG